MDRELLPGEPMPGNVTAEGRLHGHYKDMKKPAFLRVEAGRVSWHEGGRDTEDKLKIEHGLFKPAEEVMREVTGIKNYNLKLIMGGKGLEKTIIDIYRIFFILKIQREDEIF